MIMYTLSNCYEGAGDPHFVCYDDILEFIHTNYKILLEKAETYGSSCCFHFYLIEDCEISEEIHLNKEQLLELIKGV